MLCFFGQRTIQKVEMLPAEQLAAPRMSEEEFRRQVPPELIESLREKDKDKPEHGFVVKLWNLLTWAGTDPNRCHNLGLGWITDTEFFIEKARFCAVVGMPINTLNFKLRAYKFQQSKRRRSTCTYWVCEKFTRRATKEDLEAVEQRKNMTDNSPSVMLQALYLPVLEGVRIFTGSAPDVVRFKVDAILEWQEIINSWVWALDRTEFIALAADRFCRLCDSGGGETFDYDAQQTELAQYLKSNDLNLVTTARQMLNYVITTRQPNVVAIEDFCMFFARFGPSECILEKIHQLLCCSQAFGAWFQPGEQKFDQTKSVTGSYSNTFANCFIIKRSCGATYHVYNLPSSTTKTRFLVDETAKNFLTWHAVFESFSSPTQQSVSYFGDELMG